MPLPIKEREDPIMGLLAVCVSLIKPGTLFHPDTPKEVKSKLQTKTSYFSALRAEEALA